MSIVLLGGISQPEVIDYMANSDIFILPSINEVLGIVLMEVQAVGLPVIATNVGSIHEAIIDGKPGFLVPERDADAMAQRLEYLIEHLEIWRCL